MTWVALSVWPLVAVVLFKTTRLPVAFLATIIGGYLLLPTQTTFDLPVLPPLDKDNIPAFMALALVFLFHRKPALPHAPDADTAWPLLPGLLPRNRVVLVLFLMLFVAQIGTHLLNRDMLFYGPTVLPGLRPYDALSLMLATALQFLPFLLARKILSTPDGQRLLLIAIAISAAIYVLPALYEVRMSPQLNRMLYGFFPHDWSQHWRGGSWRPVVFLQHGLFLSLFFAMATIAAAVMMTLETGKNRTIWMLLAFWLFGALVLSRSLGALLICIVVLGALFLLPRRMQIVFIFGVTVCILLYPLVRAADLLPYEQLLSHVSAERARSLGVRLDFEQQLLEKANERPIFGWGGWGRSRLYNEDGLDFTIVDGTWIIWLGLGGWMKYIASFGLLTWGSLQLFWQRNRNIDPVTVGLALVLTGNLVDLIPNSGLTPITWLLAGALCGRLEYREGQTGPATPQPTPARPKTMQYARNISPVYSEAPAREQKTGERAPLPYRRDFTKGGS